jgi:hypothetical protein
LVIGCAPAITDVGQRERDVVVNCELVIEEKQGACVVVDADDRAHLAAGELAQDLPPTVPATPVIRTTFLDQESSATRAFAICSLDCLRPRYRRSRRR